MLKARSSFSRRCLFAAAVMGASAGTLLEPEMVFAQARQGQLIIVSDPPGAQVSIDGRVVGRAPVTVPDLLPGDHLVSVTGANGARSDQVATVVAGESHVVRVVLNAAATSVGSAGASSPQATPGEQASPSPTAATAPPAPVESSPSPAEPTPVAPQPTVAVPTPPEAAQSPSIFTMANLPPLHRETETIEPDVAPVAAHMNLGAAIDLMYYGRVAAFENHGRDGTGGRFRFDAMFTRVVGVQLLVYTPSFAIGAGLVLASPPIAIGSRVAIQPRFSLNFLGGPALLMTNADLETRASFALMRHLSLFVGIGGSFALALGFHSVPSYYGSTRVESAAGAYLGIFGSGGVQWVF